MIPEIKNRIEQIRHGNVPEGYKKSKLGIVPEEWEEISFSELFISTSEYTDNLEQYPLYSLTIEDGITAKSERYERSHLVKKENSYKVVRPNDYAYNPMNIRFGAVARHKGNYSVAVSGYYDIFTTIHESDFAFMDNFLTCESMITYYNKVSTGSLVEKQRVHFSDFMKFSFALPPIEERKKISKILTAQDQIIELEQQKIEELKKVKKYFISKMFPPKGQSAPEIRFKGFTDAWEQHKWIDTVDISTEMVDPTCGKFDELPHVAPGNIESFTGQLYDNVKLVKDENLISGKFRFYDGDIIYGKINPQLGKYVFARFEGLTSADAYVLNAKNGLVQEYLYSMLQTRVFFDYSVAVSKRSGMPKINRDELNAYSFLAPKSDEQKRIGELFLSLDYLITLHQRKLGEEKKKKKALMQLLLTGIVKVEEALL